MRNILTSILLLFCFSLNAQISIDHIDRMRIVDRHLKTMINMVIEIDTLTADRIRLDSQVKSLLRNISEKEENEKRQVDIIEELRDENYSLVDSVNYYKIEAVTKGYEVRILTLNDSNKELKSINRKKDIVIGSLLTILGVVTGVTVF